MPFKRVFEKLLKLFGLSAAPAPSDDPTLRYVRKDDPEMAAAWEQARNSIQDFLDELAAPSHPDCDFYVKKRFDDDAGSEHIWLIDVTVDGQDFVGQVGNDPGVVKNIRYGETARVPMHEISDWMIMQGEEIVAGGFTVELLMKRGRKN